MSRKYLLIFICLISQIARTQQYLPVEIFTDKEGLSHSHITTLYQDIDGYLWIGTANGLNKYSGYSFDTYYAELSDQSSLAGSYILKVFEDSQNRLWCLTQNGISRYDALNNSFISYYVTADSSGSQSKPVHIKDAVFNWKQNLIVLLTDQGLSQLEISSGKLSNIEFTPAQIDMTDQCGSLIYNGLKDDYFLLTSKTILHYWTNQNGIDTLTEYQVEGLRKSIEIESMFSDVSGHNWLYSKTELLRIDNEGRLYQNRLQLDKGDQILKVFQEKQGELLIATTSTLLRYYTDTDQFEAIIKFNVPIGYGAELTDFLYTPSGYFWLGTTEGLYQFNEHNFVFEPQSFSRDIFRGESISNLVFDGDGSLWVTARSGEIVVFDEFGFEQKNILASRKRFAPANKLAGLGQRDTLLAQTNSGVSLITRSRNNIQSKALYTGNISAFFKIGTDTVGIIAGNKINLISVRGKFRTRTKTIDIPLNDTILDVVVQDHVIYLLQPLQIIRYNITDETSSILTLEKLDLRVTPENSCLIAFNQSELVLGTSNGLYVLYTYDFSLLPTFINLDKLSTPVFAIEKDGEDRLWVATERGLFLLQKSNNLIRLFNHAEGLNWPHHGPYVSTKSPGGRLCFANKEKAFVFHPSSLIFNPQAPKVEISNLLLVSRHSSRSVNLTQSDTIEVNNRNSLLHFSLNVLDYWDPGKNQFKYSLVKAGKPDNWIDLGTNSELYISRLRPAQYVLKVIGANSSLVWSTEPREIVINVIAPFWRSRMAIFSYAIAVLLLFYFSIFFTTRHLRKLNREYRERELIAKKVELQKEELTQKNKNITDSLNYAKRIQEALLPSQRLFSKLFPESFILHIPKDIVSGDFYWINEVDGRIYFAAVDCTGHGVPGAFMSIIGFELFRRITEQEKKKQPAEILNSLSDGFASIFRDIENITLRDGMDLAFCALDKERKILEFAGAFNPLYLIRDNTISEIKGDRFSVGLNQMEDNASPQEFQHHVIELKEDDVIYIFTDGYADQFGGPEGKKYKYRRFRHLLLALHQLPMDRQLEFLRRSIMDWKGDLDQVDDILVMGIRINNKPDSKKSS